jgi:hypothetical protein
MGKLYVLLGVLVVCGCTYSITMVHNQGAASDLIDETQNASPNVNPTLSIPASLIP